MTNLTCVTQGAMASQTLQGLQDNLNRLQDVQHKLSTGKQFSRPSEDPGSAVAALSYRADVRRMDQYSRNAQDGLAWLGSADSTLTSMLPQVQRVKELVLQGADATVSNDERNAIAAEVDTIRDSLLGLANTTHLNRPIFAGTASVS